MTCEGCGVLSSVEPTVTQRCCRIACNDCHYRSILHGKPYRIAMGKEPVENLNVFGDAERALLDRLVDVESKLAMCIGCLTLLREDVSQEGYEQWTEAIDKILGHVSPISVDVEKV